MLTELVGFLSETLVDLVGAPKCMNGCLASLPKLALCFIGRYGAVVLTWRCTVVLVFVRNVTSNIGHHASVCANRANDFDRSINERHLGQLRRIGRQFRKHVKSFKQGAKNTGDAAVTQAGPKKVGKTVCINEAHLISAALHRISQASKVWAA